MGEHEPAGKIRPGGVPLGEKDRRRMARLYEEVDSRIKEMALIIARTLGRDSSQVVATSAKLQLPPQGKKARGQVVASTSETGSALEQGQLG
jgi:hypothetical protein